MPTHINPFGPDQLAKIIETTIPQETDGEHVSKVLVLAADQHGVAVVAKFEKSFDDRGFSWAFAGAVRADVLDVDHPGISAGGQVILKWK